MDRGSSIPHQSCTLLLLFGLLTLPTGCMLLLVGGAAAGTITYLQGELKTIVDAPLDRTWRASVAAVEALEFRVTDRRKDGLSALVTAESSDDTEIKIGMEKRSKSSTEIKIRVGIFGDKEKSNMILSVIRERL